MFCLYHGISSLDDDSKGALMAKYRNIFTRVKFLQTFNLWVRDKATVLDLSGYSHSIQILLAQLVISILWRYYRIYGQRMNTGTWIVLDEFQNFPLHNGSLLAQLLREGRKYNLSLLLATQTLAAFDIPKRGLLQQAGTKLYFQQTEVDINRLAKEFSGIEAADAKSILQGLKVGECLVDGEFSIFGKTVKRALKIRF